MFPGTVPSLGNSIRLFFRSPLRVRLELLRVPLDATTGTPSYGMPQRHNGDTQLCALESDQRGYTGSKEATPSTLVDDRDY